MCPVNTEQDTASHLNLPNGPRVWSCSRTRTSNCEQRVTPTTNIVDSLYLHKCRCFFSSFSSSSSFSNSVTKKKCPSRIYSRTKRGKRCTRSWNMNWSSEQLGQSQQVSLLTVAAYRSFSWGHTQTHTSVVSRIDRKRDREGALQWPFALLLPSSTGSAHTWLKTSSGWSTTYSMYWYNNYSFFIFNFLQILLLYTHTHAYTHTHKLNSSAQCLPAPTGISANNEKTKQV